MKKIFITTTLIFISTLLLAQDEIFKAAWTTTVKVDGSGDEWTNPLRYYDADTKLSFAFANDDKNLYLCFQTNDNLNQMKIMHAGMEIYLSIKGGHTATINFPMPGIEKPPTQQSENVDLENKTDPDRPEAFMIKNAMMEVKGFLTKNGIISANDSSGIHAALNQDPRNKFTCEIAIPLKELFGLNYTAADIKKHISLAVKLNAMKGVSHSGKSNAMNNNYAAKSRGGGGRMGGAGMHHNGNGNSAEGNKEELKEDKTDLSKKTEFKQKFILAQK